MIIGVLEVSIHIPSAQSLKDKRKVVQSLKDRIRNHFNVSLAETDGQDVWQRCTLAAAMVASHRTAIARDFERILQIIEAQPEIDGTEYEMEYY